MTLNPSAAPILEASSTGLVLQDTYTLGLRIGQGGMGEIYEAAHVRLPGRFAVKILRPELLTNPEARARFCREAELMSELRHPHIIQIFDFNTSVEGVPYFVMEHLDGIDLETRLIASGALPLTDVVPIVEAVASALAAAHAMGVVHRDLKPANIFLVHGEGQDEDFVKVIDFGISKTTGPGARVSRASEVIGTPAFMSPEQALGLTAQIDARTDQFALAGITILMLTGRAPFGGDDPASSLYRVVHEFPPPLSDFLSWDTTAVQGVLDRGLAKRPEDRFESIGDFAAALVTAAAAAMDPSVAPALPTDLEDAPPPIRRPQIRLLEVLPPEPDELVEAVRPVEPPRSVDRIPRGPQRAIALGLAVLGLAAVIVHEGWYEGFPRHAMKAQRDVVSLVHRQWRAHRPTFASLPPISSETP